MSTQLVEKVKNHLFDGNHGGDVTRDEAETPLHLNTVFFFAFFLKDYSLSFPKHCLAAVIICVHYKQ